MRPTEFWRLVFTYVGAIYLGLGLAVLIVQVLADENLRWQILSIPSLVLVVVVWWSSRIRAEIRQLEQEQQEALRQARESFEALERLLDRLPNRY